LTNLKLSKELKTGIIAVFAISLSIWGYNFLKKQNVFESSRVYYSEFKNVQGLTTASIVSINGLQVGNVLSIKFNPKKRGTLIVSYSINNNFRFSKNSITKIKPRLMGGAELILIPDYNGKDAASGDYLVGNAEKSMFASITDKLNPLDAKLNTVLLDADKLLVNINNTLDTNTQKNIKSSIAQLNKTLHHFKSASKSIDELLAENKIKFNTILNNTNDATKSLKSLTADIEKANLANDLKQTMAKLNTSLSSFDQILSKMNNGEGSIGKLLKDEGLYNNLENASKEMEELLREMKEHPKRFVHFSLFGKKDKRGYVKDSVN